MCVWGSERWWLPVRNFPYQQVTFDEPKGQEDGPWVLIYRAAQLDAHAAQVTRAGRKSAVAILAALGLGAAIDAGLWFAVWRLFFR